MTTYLVNTFLFGATGNLLRIKCKPQGLYRISLHKQWTSHNFDGLSLDLPVDKLFYDHDSTKLKEIKSESMFLFSSHHRTNGHKIELESTAMYNFGFILPVTQKQNMLSII